MITKKSKHTLGPWYWGDSHVYSGEILPKNNPANLHDYHAIIAECSRPENARLIAAAPDLLAALEFCSDALNTEAGGLYKAHLDQARAAIAKAKGE